MNPLVLLVPLTIATPAEAKEGAHACKRAVKVEPWVLGKEGWEEVVGHKIERAGKKAGGTCVVAKKEGEKPRATGFLKLISDEFIVDDDDSSYDGDLQFKRTPVNAKGADWIHIQIHGSDFNAASGER